MVKHFESMIQSPRHFAKRICKEVGLDINQNESAIAEWACRVQNTNNEHFIEAKTSRNYSRADHQTRIDRWKENLSPEEIQKVIPIVKDTAEQFGYRLDQIQDP